MSHYDTSEYENGRKKYATMYGRAFGTLLMHSTLGGIFAAQNPPYAVGKFIPFRDVFESEATVPTNEFVGLYNSSPSGTHCAVIV